MFTDHLAYGALIGESPSEVDVRWGGKTGDGDKNTTKLFAPQSAIIVGDIGENRWHVRSKSIFLI